MQIFEQHRVQLAQDHNVDLEIRQAQGSTVIYSVHVPVHRVMPPSMYTSDFDDEDDYNDGAGGWDEGDQTSDPSERFPAGC